MTETDTDLRDQLAIERTQLANERTLLAYVRTALASAAGGAALLRFYPTHPVLTLVAWGMMIAGSILTLFGLYRFIAVRRRVG